MTVDTVSLLRLARTENVGPVTWRRLMREFDDARSALDAVPEISRKAGKRGPLSIPSLESVLREIEGVERLGGRILTLHDPEYPALLAELPDSPPVLSVLGDITLLAARGVGIVGARNASAAGMRFAESLATELVEAGLCVTSGLARGIDGAAHQGALHRGRTIAAIAGGLDIAYPPEHADLQARIAANGAVITEAPLGTLPQARHFPRRNRLIAGLSLGCVVVEAALRSGSLITARLVESYNRQLFAVPGSPLDPRCRGSNDLLRQGAILVETAADIVPFLPERPPSRADVIGFSEPSAPWGEPSGIGDDAQAPIRLRVLELLSFAPVSVDDLARHCQFSVSAVLAALTSLELAGRAECRPGGGFALVAQDVTTEGAVSALSDSLPGRAQ